MLKDTKPIQQNKYLSTQFKTSFLTLHTKGLHHVPVRMVNKIHPSRKIKTGALGRQAKRLSCSQREKLQSSLEFLYSNIRYQKWNNTDSQEKECESRILCASAHGSFRHKAVAKQLNMQVFQKYDTHRFFLGTGSEKQPESTKKCLGKKKGNRAGNDTEYT